MSDIKIKAENVRKVFELKHSGKSRSSGRWGNNGGCPRHLMALDGVNLSVRTGEFMAIVGPSGCGKSTFLDMIGGLSRPTDGQIFIDDKPITGPSLNRGIVFQQYALFPWRTALENIEYGLESQKIPKKERADIARRYLSLVNLSDFEGHYPYQLSGGMKQRIAIARALAYNPDILLMDEPFGALDAQTRETLQLELLKIKEETRKTVIFITHSIEEAVFLADKTAIMTASPGVIKEVVDIPLSYETRLSDEFRVSEEFTRLKQKLWSLLKVEVRKSQELGGICPPECQKCPEAS